MPPKKKPPPGGNKKQTQKVVDDRTFGMKNKKGSKAQKYIKNVHQSVSKAKAVRDSDNLKNQRQVEKQEKTKRELELAELFKPVINKQKAPQGVDPKSVICEFFKKGQCTKGNKCKFSHDTAVERKAERIDLYTDPRDIKEQNETMENWDQEKLNEVINQKFGKEAGKTEKICKYFLEALENKKYGWFWECPNGEKCIYRHALPPGYVLKIKDDIPKELKEERILEDILEDERKKLKGNLTPITSETFKSWKEKILKEKLDKQIEAEKKRQEAVKSGKAIMSGRELLVFKPELFLDEDEDTVDIPKT